MCICFLLRELFTSDIDLVESESRISYATREGRRNSEDPAPGVLKTLFEQDTYEDGIKGSS